MDRNNRSINNEGRFDDRNKVYAVVQDIGGGTARILTGHQQKTFHETFIDAFETLEEAQCCFDSLTGQDIYAVFTNYAEHNGFVSVENNTSGNWRGSKYGHYSVHSEHDNKESAEQALSKYLQCDAEDNGSYCFTHNPSGR